MIWEKVEFIHYFFINMPLLTSPSVTFKQMKVLKIAQSTKKCQITQKSIASIRPVIRSFKKLLVIGNYKILIEIETWNSKEKRFKKIESVIDE